MQELIYVTKGSKIKVKAPACRYRYAFFTLKRPGRYLYTYDYQEQECWYSYSQEFSADGWLEGGLTFGERNLPPAGEGMILPEVLRADQGTAIPVADWRDYLEICPAITDEEISRRKAEAFLQREDVKAEIANTVRKICELSKHEEEGASSSTVKPLVFTLLADSHYVLNGNWEMTAATIEAVNGQIKPDGIIHLGDFTDGILDKETCRAYSGRILNRIRSWGLPFYLTIGNHDSNYFRGNPEVLSEQEQYEYYLKGIVSGNLKEGQLWYDADLPEQKLRMIFLHSYDNREKLRYGFPEEEISWVAERLADLPEDYCVILFSHEAPLPELDYWASEIRGSRELTELLEQWHRDHGQRILALIHGHTHADYLYEKRAFPIVSVGCSKIEYFPDKKPEGSIRQVREENTAYQELWDTMILHVQERRIDLVRFGAGMDRCVGGKEAMNEEFNKPQIWAHRGASGYAPENTLEAFRLAAQMKADGVELDVQFTKDRQLVVIHDETINRTSDGQGYVADHTLEELRRFNYNRTHPEYAHADIPTLREVLELLQPTEMTVNIELKTGVRFYPGLEEAVVETVRETGMQERVIYSSFNHASVLKVREYDPDARLGFLYCDGTMAMPDYAKAHGVYALHPAVYNLKYPGFIEECREKDVKLHVWTVNEPGVMKEMAQMGVDSIITNYPDVAREALRGEQSDGEALVQEAIAACNKKVGVKGASVQRKKNGILHAAGVTYSVVRKGFVKIDRWVQRMAGK